MGKTLTLNQETGQLTAPEKESVPKRSWRRGDGGYNAKIEWEGAKIYIAFPEDWEEIKTQKATLAKQVRELKALLPGIKEKEENGLLGDEEQASLEKQNDELARNQIELNNLIISKCVIGWTGAPFPFSEQERDSLPVEIKAEWAGLFDQASQLSQKEADFLKPYSTSG